MKQIKISDFYRMGTRILKLSLVLFFIFFNLNCDSNCSEVPENYNSSENTQVESNSSNQIQHKSNESEISQIVCPSCNNTKRCAVCGGSGMIIWYDGSYQTCYSCDGSRVCSVCDPVKMQAMIEQTNRQFYGQNSTYSGSEGSSRSNSAIDWEIDKTEKLLRDCETAKERLEENVSNGGSGVVLIAQYNTMIIELREKLNNLEMEKISAGN